MIRRTEEEQKMGKDTERVNVRDTDIETGRGRVSDARKCWYGNTPENFNGKSEHPC